MIYRGLDVYFNDSVYDGATAERSGIYCWFSKEGPRPQLYRCYCVCTNIPQNWGRMSFWRAKIVWVSDLFEITQCTYIYPSTRLTKGLGQLTDGTWGLDDFLHSHIYGMWPGYDYVGWSNKSFPRGYVEMIFEFDHVRNFTSMKVRSSGKLSQAVQPDSMGEKKKEEYFQICWVNTGLNWAVLCHAGQAPIF